MLQVRNPQEAKRVLKAMISGNQPIQHICTGDPKKDRGRVIKVWGLFNNDDPYPIGVDFGSSKKSKQYESTRDTHILYDICNWLFGTRAVVGNWLKKEINQAKRDCQVVSVKRTRCRLEYEMPNAGPMGGWHPIVEMFDEKIVESSCRYTLHWM